MLLFSSLVATVVIGLTFSATSESFQISDHWSDYMVRTNKSNSRLRAISSGDLDIYGKKDLHKIYNSLATLIKSRNMSQYNVASDKDERTLVLPKMTHVVVPKKRKIKKVPRRTIQKIIKKTKKNKKTLNQATKSPTEPTRYEAKETTSTTQATQKKKVRKWNSKYARYPMPFQKLSSKKDFTTHRRNRRDVDRDLYILEDLDEMEFLSDENDENAIKTHVKRYW